MLKMYDYQGREIGYWILDNESRELTLEVEDWVSGVYLYSLEIGGERIEEGKLLIDH